MNVVQLNTISLDNGKVIKRGGNGGGATINNQSKVVEITENGSVEVVPDAGYTGLTKVTANVNVSGGGGGELEGEYYLAKANEYYWKPNLPLVEKMTWDMPEYRAYKSLCTLFTQVGATFEGVRFNGLRSGYKDVNFLLQTHFNASSGDSTIYNPIIAVRESDIDNPNFGKYRSLVELYKTTGEQQGTPMTDDEVVTLLEEFGITRITKEEYESLITA